MDLQGLAAEVEQIFFVINIYTKGRTFAQVANPYCRIFSAQGDELCRYQLREAGNEQALIMARLFREPGDCRWGFQAIGQPCRGQTYKDSLPAVAEYARTRPQDLAMTRSFSTMSAGGDIARAPSVGGDTSRHPATTRIIGEPPPDPAIESGTVQNECACV